MDINVVLNRCHRFSKFVYGKNYFLGDRIDVEVGPRRGCKPVCAGCNKPGPIYDTASKPHGFEFIPLWGFAVFLWYAMRRVDCRRCGVTIERVPWAEGKTPACNAYRLFLSRWAKRLSWSEVAEIFGTSWGVVLLTLEILAAREDFSAVISTEYEAERPREAARGVWGWGRAGELLRALRPQPLAPPAAYQVRMVRIRPTAYGLRSARPPRATTDPCRYPRARCQHELVAATGRAVYRSVQWVVAYGLAHRTLGKVGAMGIDEIAVWAGHKYLTVVYQIDAGRRRLLWCGWGETGPRRPWRRSSPSSARPDAKP